MSWQQAATTSWSKHITNNKKGIYKAQNVVRRDYSKRIRAHKTHTHLTHTHTYTHLQTQKRTTHTHTVTTYSIYFSTHTKSSDHSPAGFSGRSDASIPVPQVRTHPQQQQTPDTAILGHWCSATLPAVLSPEIPKPKRFTLQPHSTSKVQQLSTPMHKCSNLNKLLTQKLYIYIYGRPIQWSTSTQHVTSFTHHGLHHMENMWDACPMWVKITSFATITMTCESDNLSSGIIKLM